MSILDDREYALMREVRRTNVIPRGEETVAYRLSQYGFLRLGFDDEGEEYCETASLTSLGRRQFIRERRDRSVIRSTFHSIFGPLYARVC